MLPNFWGVIGIRSKPNKPKWSITDEAIICPSINRRKTERVPSDPIETETQNMMITPKVPARSIQGEEIAANAPQPFRNRRRLATKACAKETPMIIASWPEFFPICELMVPCTAPDSPAPSARIMLKKKLLNVMISPPS